MIRLIDEEVLSKAKMDAGIARAFLSGKSGVVLHEVGHLYAAAKLGVPADFMILNWGSPSCIYIDESLWDITLNGSNNESVLVAGYSAELLVFGESDLTRAKDDLQKLSPKIFGMDPKGIIHIAAQLSGEYNILDVSDLDELINLYNGFADIINSGALSGKGRLIKHCEFPRFNHKIPFFRKVQSSFRSKREANQVDAVNSFVEYMNP